MAKRTDVRNRTLRDMRREEALGRQPKRIKGQVSDISEGIRRHVKDPKNRAVTVMDGRVRIEVPLLTSEECLDICERILEGAENEWEMVQEWRELTVDDVKEELNNGDAVFDSVFGGLDDKKIQEVLAKYNEDKDHIRNKDDAIASIHRAMMLDVAFRDERKKHGTDAVATAMDLSTVAEIGRIIEVMNEQIGLDKYIEDKALEEDGEDDADAEDKKK